MHSDLIFLCRHTA